MVPQWTLAIVVHARNRYPGKNLIELLADEWRRSGIVISIVRSPQDVRDADCAVLHVDLTRTPPDYIDLLSRYPRVVNGAVVDISKNLVCTHCVLRGDGYDGPVIVKTQRNVGGASERNMVKHHWSGKLLNNVTRKLPWTWTARLRTSQYPIYESPRHVPLAVWFNPRLVVQRFLCERHGELYSMRQWVFFGSAERNVMLFGRNPILKASSIEHQEDLGEVPEELRALRRRLGFDYGKFDYGIVNGEVIVYDTNRTPSFSRNPPSEQTLKTVRFLAAGLNDFLP